MSLQEQVNTDIIVAMKAKDEVALRALRGLKSALLLAATEKGASEDGKLTDEASIKVFQKLAKQRRESLEIYTQNNRADLAKGEADELAVIEKYLPKQLSSDEIKALLKDVITQNGATSAADFGKVMPIAMKALAGKADGKIISSLLKEILG